MRGSLLMAIAACASAVAFQVSAGDAPPEWLRRPTPSDLLSVWPRQAWRDGVSGKTEIACKVSVRGVLHGCVVVWESPPNAGFGAAALALTPQLTFRPATHYGQPVEDVVHIPVNFFFWGAGAKEGAPGSRIPAGRYFEPMPAPAHSDLVVTHVPWLATPSYPEVLAAYPAKARAQGVGGHVVLNCRFDRHARLSQCDTLLEQPPKYGFGQAAKALAQAFVAPPTLSDGTSLQETSTQIEMTFAAEMLGDRAPIMRARQWTVLPDRANLVGSFVAAARAAHVVQAGLQCLVDPGGTLSDCTALSKEPAGAEFTTAALALAPLIRVPVWTDEGLPVVGGRIAVPLRYEAAGLASPPELMEQRPQPPLISPTIPPSTMAR